MIRRIAGEKVAAANPAQLRVVHNVYGGAYGRPLETSRDPAKLLQRAMGLRLDDTYSAKAWTAVLGERSTEKGPALFWLTFDATCLTS